MTPPREDQELVEECIAAIERICPPEYSVRTDQVKQALCTIIPIIRQHEHAKAQASMDAVAEHIAKMEREKIARELVAYLDGDRSEVSKYIDAFNRSFFRKEYGIEVGND